MLPNPSICVCKGEFENGQRRFVVVEEMKSLRFSSTVLEIHCFKVNILCVLGVFCLRVCLLTTFMQYPQKPAEGIRSLKPKLQMGVGNGTGIRPPEEQPTTESLHYPSPRTHSYGHCHGELWKVLVVACPETSEQVLNLGRMNLEQPIAPYCAEGCGSPMVLDNRVPRLLPLVPATRTKI